MSAPDMDQELVERMIALVRGMANPGDVLISERYAEAAEIAALLPEPVDPDLLEAREMMVREYRIQADIDAVRAGKCDAWYQVALRLEGIKKGRELERAKVQS